MTKNQVKEKSASLGLDRFLPSRESQELCFVNGNYTDFINQLGEEGLDCPGPIVNRQGEILGRHRGLEYYTVGQRQGLGVPAPAPYYVLEIFPELNQLVIGFKEELKAAALEVEDINWLIPPPAEPLRAKVRLRFRHPGVGCLISPSGLKGRQGIFRFSPDRHNSGAGGSFLPGRAGFRRRLDRPRH